MKKLLVALAILLVPIGALALEKLDLAVPETKPDNTAYRVEELCLKRTNAKITIMVVGDNGEVKRFEYDDTEATTLMKQLNKADLSTNSLHRRILNKLVSDGLLDGTVSGTPD